MSNSPVVVTPVAELEAWGDLSKKSGIVPPSTSRTLGRSDESITCTYTHDDARKVGLVKTGGAWEKHGRQMFDLNPSTGGNNAYLPAT
jgi:hypothetical protein